MKNGDRGSATVENIIWLPVMLLLLGSIVQLGIYFNARIAVQTASYEAARQAAIAPDPVTRAEEIAYDFGKESLPGWQAGQRVSVKVEPQGELEPGSTVTVDVTYDVPPFLTGILPVPENAQGWLSVNGETSTTIEERP